MDFSRDELMEEASVSSRDLVNILVVDDRPENVLTISAILDSPDYRIVTANSGPQALSCLLRHEFAVVVLDVMMPEMDGYQVAALMKQRERTRDVPIIFLRLLQPISVTFTADIPPAPWTIC